MHEISKPLDVSSIESMIQNVPDFPKPGVLFKDITPILADPLAFRSCIRHMATLVKGHDFNKIVAIESRGFLLGSALAEHLHKGLVLVRKPGKLPRPTMTQTYDLEYGQDSLQIHRDDLSSNDRVLIVDDVLATGGTAHATETLCKKLGAKVEAHLFLMSLEFLAGAEKLSAPSHSLFQIG